MKLQIVFFSTLFVFGTLISSISAACVVAPFNETWSPQGSVEWTPTGDDCALHASIRLSIPPAAATVNYRRADRSAPLHMSFVVAQPTALTMLDASQSASLAKGTAFSIPAAGPDQASLFRIVLVGSSSATQPVIGVEAACASPAGANGICSAQAPISMSDFPLRITLDLEMGIGSAGRLRVWLGDDTAGAPAVSLEDLDNARWEGIDRVGLGLSDVSDSLATAIGTQPFIFSGISVSDPQLFWSGFESDVVGSIVANGTVLSGDRQTITENTCGGSTQLPDIAFGSTHFGGPTVIHPVTLGAGQIINIGLAPLAPVALDIAMFSCPQGSGPSGPCLEATRAMTSGLRLFGPGSFQVVVGSLQQGCGSYVLTVSGSGGV
jgi:hypothetical protein